MSFGKDSLSRRSGSTAATVWSEQAAFAHVPALIGKDLAE
jgi:hypothetical protein